MPRKAIMTRDGTRTRPSPAQYAALRYWAGNTVDQAAQYIATHGPAPRVQDRTAMVLIQRRWWRWIASGYVVTDAGRRAVGLLPVDRDDSCATCGARPGARCRDINRPGGPYMQDVHTARLPGAAPAPSFTESMDGLRHAMADLGLDPSSPVGLVCAT